MVNWVKWQEVLQYMVDPNCSELKTICSSPCLHPPLLEEFLAERAGRSCAEKKPAVGARDNRSYQTEDRGVLGLVVWSSRQVLHCQKGCSFGSHRREKWMVKDTVEKPFHLSRKFWQTLKQFSKRKQGLSSPGVEDCWPKLEIRTSGPDLYRRGSGLRI